MAALTANSVVRESVGSLTLLIVNLTAQGTSDTYTLYAGAPIVGVFASGANAGTSASFVQDYLMPMFDVRYLNFLSIG